MTSQPTRRTRRQEREFQANRQHLEDYVNRPTEKAAAYMWQVGTGASFAIIGLMIRATYAGSWMVALSGLMIAFSVPFAVSGLFGWIMLNRRLDAFFWDILNNKAKATTEETFDYGGDEQAVDTVRPLTVNKGGKPKTVIEVDDPDAKFTRGHLEAFAVAVLCRKSGMTKGGVTRQTINSGWQYRKISQPMWGHITGWMLAQKPPLATKDATNATELNGAGYDWLCGYVPEHEVIHLSRPD